MSKEELIEALESCASEDIETGHIEGDQLLLKYINDPEITAAYEAIHKWYA